MKECSVICIYRTLGLKLRLRKPFHQLSKTEHVSSPLTKTERLGCTLHLFFCLDFWLRVALNAYSTSAGNLEVLQFSLPCTRIRKSEVEAQTNSFRDRHCCLCTNLPPKPQRYRQSRQSAYLHHSQSTYHPHFQLSHPNSSYHQQHLQ